MVLGLGFGCSTGSEVLGLRLGLNLGLKREEIVAGPVGELALVTLGNRMGHCMGLRIGYSMSTMLSSANSVCVCLCVADWTEM